MSKRTLRRYTDEELGHVLNTLDRPAREVAEALGRPGYAIDKMRRLVRSGWAREREPWTDDEIEVIQNPGLTVRQMAERLPGRTEGAITTRRHVLQVNAGNFLGSDLNPAEVRGRTLLAKTCLRCGLLLPADWFGSAHRRGSGRKVWRPYCRKCASASATDSKKARGDGGASSRAYEAKAQAITIPLAEKRGSEYTEEDHKVLSDPSLTRLAKALILKRTYRAASSQCSLHGYKSNFRLGSPEKDRWIIDNPNADRIEEIAAMLNQTEPATSTRPDFEWDD